MDDTIRQPPGQQTLGQSPLGRRQSPRVALSMGAVVNAGEGSVRGKLVNLSLGGALFESRQRRCYFPGPCVLQVALGRTPEQHISIPISIVRAQRGQFALEWKQRLPADEYSKLRGFMKA
jgi:hypothetical protein